MGFFVESEAVVVASKATGKLEADTAGGARNEAGSIDYGKGFSKKLEKMVRIRNCVRAGHRARGGNTSRYGWPLPPAAP